MTALCCAYDSRGIFFYEYLEGPEEPDLPTLGPEMQGQEKHFGLVSNDGSAASRQPTAAWHAYGKAIQAFKRAG
jgi:hypothetical protein